MAFVLTPAQAYNSVLDYTTNKGRKLLPQLKVYTILMKVLTVLLMTTMDSSNLYQMGLRNITGTIPMRKSNGMVKELSLFPRRI